MQPVLIGIGAYLVVQFAFGMLVSRRIASESDYLLAGRRLGVTLAAFSIFATWFGAETVVGAAGLDLFRRALRRLGRSVRLWALPRRARRRRRRAAVAAQVHDVRRPVPRALFAGRRAPRRAAHGADVGALGRGADPRVRPGRQRVVGSRGRSVAITAAAAFVVVYTVAGGLLADVVTDFVQSIAIVVGLAVLLVVVGNAHGGIARARRVDRSERARAVLDGRRDAARDRSKRGPCPSAARCSPSRCCRASWAARARRRRATRRCSARRSISSVGLIPVTIGLAGPRARAGARGARAARRVARAAAPVDVPLRACSRAL